MELFVILTIAIVAGAVIYWLRQHRSEFGSEPSEKGSSVARPRASAAEHELERRATEAATSGDDLDALHLWLQQRTEELGLGPSRIRSALSVGFRQAVVRFIDDGDISEEEDSRLQRFASKFDLTQDDVGDQAWTQWIKGRLLRRIADGYLPSDVSLQIVGRLPFNLQKSETLIWVFPNSDYITEISSRYFEGGSRGVSFRVAKGVYLRGSSFRGQPKVETTTAAVDSGLVGITTKHVYFNGAPKSFRVPYRKIVSTSSFSDGFGIQRDAATAKPEAFRTGDGWFSVNLVDLLAAEPDLVDYPARG